MCKNQPNSKLSCTKTFMVFIWGIWKPFQPSHLKNHEFQFFTKFPTKPSSYAVVHRQPWPWAKTHRTENFRAPRLSRLGTFGGVSNHHFSKTTNFNFSQNSPPSHLAMPWCTDQLGRVENAPNSKLSCTKTFMVFIWGHLEANPTLISKKPRISIFHKTPHQAI